MDKRIFAFDPGKTCGIAQVYLAEKKPAIITKALEIPGTPEAIYSAFHDWFDPLAAGKPIIIIEGWDSRNNPADVTIACYPIGWLQMLGHEYGIEVVMQRPQFRLSIPDIEGLTPQDWWLPNLKTHDDRRQALRHALAHICFTEHHLPTLRHLRPIP